MPWRRRRGIARGSLARPGGATPKKARSLAAHRRELSGRGALDGHSSVAMPRTRGRADKIPAFIAISTISRANPHHDTAGTVEKW